LRIKGLGSHHNKNPLTVCLPQARLVGMKVIGLTGGIGSGKSTVSRFLAELGAVIVDADKVGHETLKPDTEAWREVVAAFSTDIVKPNREIDRKKLGGIVFASAEALARLNEIVQPRIYDMVKAKIEEYRRQGVEVVVLEAPLLIDVPLLMMKAGEPSLLDVVDEVWVTVAPEPTVLRRLKKKLGLSKQESLARIRSQLSSEEKIKQADVVIDTDCSLDELKAKIKELWQRRLTPG
jgi:dephospho-CoA kinase